MPFNPLAGLISDEDLDIQVLYDNEPIEIAETGEINIPGIGNVEIKIGLPDHLHILHVDGNRVVTLQEEYVRENGLRYYTQEVGVTWAEDPDDPSKGYPNTWAYPRNGFRVVSDFRDSISGEWTDRSLTFAVAIVSQWGRHWLVGEPGYVLQLARAGDKRILADTTDAKKPRWRNVEKILPTLHRGEVRDLPHIKALPRRKKNGKKEFPEGTAYVKHFGTLQQTGHLVTADGVDLKVDFWACPEREGGRRFLRKGEAVRVFGTEPVPDDRSWFNTQATDVEVVREV